MTKENFITLKNLYERIEFILKCEHLTDEQKLRYVDQSFSICHNTLKEIN